MLVSYAVALDGAEASIAPGRVESIANGEGVLLFVLLHRLLVSQLGELFAVDCVAPVLAHLVLEALVGTR